jgi:hypothetical protein
MSKPVDLDKLRSVTTARGLSRRRPAETRSEDGSRTKAVTDENNATVTEHTRPGSGVSHRQDVEIRPQTVKLGDGR